MNTHLNLKRFYLYGNNYFNYLEFVSAKAERKFNTILDLNRRNVHIQHALEYVNFVNDFFCLYVAKKK